MTHLPALLARHWRGLAELAGAWLAVSLAAGLALGRAVRLHNPVNEEDGP